MSTGTLSWILSAMSIAGKIIAAKVRCARLEDVLGDAGSGNVQGRRYLDWAQSRGYSSRYVGSMVADVHRILRKWTT